MKITYKRIDELCKTQAAARVSITATLSNGDGPDTSLLDEFIEKLQTLLRSQPQNGDISELRSDLEFIIEYYEEKSWRDVTRWLTNIDSSLREFWQNYIKALKKR
jgi:hypothetical protein